MTTVRIVFALQSLRAARAPDGSDVPGWWPHQRLIVLADTAPAEDGGHRAVPLWLIAGHKGLLGRLGRPAADAEVTSGLLETAVRLLGTRSRHASGWPRPREPGRSRSAPSTAWRWPPWPGCRSGWPMR